MACPFLSECPTACLATTLMDSVVRLTLVIFVFSENHKQVNDSPVTKMNGI